MKIGLNTKKNQRKFQIHRVNYIVAPAVFNFHAIYNGKNDFFFSKIIVTGHGNPSKIVKQMSDSSRS